MRRVASCLIVATSAVSGIACDPGNEAELPSIDAPSDQPSQADIDAALEKARSEIATKNAAKAAAEPPADASEPAVTGVPARDGGSARGGTEQGDDPLAGITDLDLSQLNAAKREVAGRVLDSEPSGCGKSHSLITSMKTDPACIESRVIAELLIDNLRTGRDELELRRLASKATRALTPQSISVGGRPVYGRSSAPVTIVVFADFECPHCAREAPKVRRVVDESKGKAKLVYKHYPLSHHPGAKRAAAASEAVFAQNPKAFWEFHAWIFANQGKLFSDPPALDGKLREKAAQLGLNMARYDGFVRNERGVGNVQSDHSDGRRAGVSSTPAVFVNGRHVSALLWGGSLSRWIDFALRRDGR
jgi:protein-disulfide isomerase